MRSRAVTHSGAGQAGLDGGRDGGGQKRRVRIHCYNYDYVYRPICLIRNNNVRNMFKDR